MFRESGLFGELQRRVLNPEKVPDFDIRFTTFSNEIEVLNIPDHLKAIFTLYLIVNISSFILLFIEYGVTII